MIGRLNRAPPFASCGPSRYPKFRQRCDQSICENESVKLIPAEAKPRTTDDTSTVQPHERTAESRHVTPLVVFLFLSLGLPGAGILAWLVIKANRKSRIAEAMQEHLGAEPCAPKARYAVLLQQSVR